MTFFFFKPLTANSKPAEAVFFSEVYIWTNFNTKLSSSRNQSAFENF